MIKRLFRRKHREISGRTLTGEVCRYLEGRQRKMADWLNNKTVNVPAIRVRYVLIAFCTISAVYLLWLIVSAF